MPQKPKFRLNGKPLAEHRTTNVTAQIVAYCSKMSDGELLDARELAVALKHSHGYTQKYSALPACAPFKVLVQLRGTSMFVFGNAKTIKKLTKELEGA